MTQSGDRPAVRAAPIAWLRLAADELPKPLSRDECLLLATAVVEASGRDAGPDAAGGSGAVPDGLDAVAARIPQVAAWLEAVPAGGDGRVARLATSILLAPDALASEDREGGGPADGGAPEAILLREAVRLCAARARERRCFERRVAEARLEGLRELAYGAGHEINNPLANIASRAQALLLDEVDAERRRRLATIVDQSFRARDMIGGLMLFARPPKPRPEAVDVSGLVAAAIDAVQPVAAARGARLEYSPLPVPLDVVVDRVQIEEVIRVVAVNAIEAVSAGGRVVLSVIRGAEGGCEIAIADDGRGMTAEALRRAFDPFYSGREAGRGIGLGLPKAWRLVEANGGGIVVDSRPGQGTRVAIKLPWAGAAAEEMAPGAPAAEKSLQIS
jgi:signal transduction histidine kinase